MTTITRAATQAPSRPKFRPFLRLFARLPDMFFQGHADSKLAQDLRHADDAILKDIGVNRVAINGKPHLFPHSYD
ncbi:MAG: hypothetical protein QNJ35_17825 [Paracoccaceae bacterium]|nr:hypothetical protein [Paracoccaceae bacterium]